RAHAGRVDVQSPGDFGVAEIGSAQQEQLGIARVQLRQNAAHVLALFGGGAFLLRGAGRDCRTRFGFVLPPARASAQLIESEAYGRGIDPASGIFTLSFGSAPQFPERFSGEIFRARMVADDAGNGMRDPAVIRLEERVEVESAGADLHGCVHNTPTPPGSDL